MRSTLDPAALTALSRATTALGVLAVAADASMGERTIRRALRGERLNDGSVRTLSRYLRAWEGALAA